MEGNKLVWVKFKDIPISLWSISCFREVLAMLGMITMIDKKTKIWEQIDYIYICIKIPIGTTTMMNKPIRISDLLTHNRIRKSQWD